MLKELVICSTYFPRKNIHKHTWISLNGLTKNQIDHVMIIKKYMSCISNVRNYKGADADTDHYVIIAHFRMPYIIEMETIIKNEQLEIQC